MKTITSGQSKIIAVATAGLLTLELAALVVVLLSFAGVATNLRRGALVLALLVLPFPIYLLTARLRASVLVALNAALLLAPVLAAVWFLLAR